jgi:hypothetical protein
MYVELGSPLRLSTITETWVGAIGWVRNNLGTGNKLRAASRYRPISPDLGLQRAGNVNITRGFSALDRREDRLRQRVWIVGRACLAPDPGEVSHGAEFKQTRFLASAERQSPGANR